MAPGEGMGRGRRLLVLQGESHSDLLFWLHRPEPLPCARGSQLLDNQRVPASSTLDEALASGGMGAGRIGDGDD